MSKMILSGKGRRWLLNGHPWIYADDVADGEATPGELVPVHAPQGELLGWALFSAKSKIALRMVTREEQQPNREFWLGRMQRAIQARINLGMLEPEGACRLISGDAEGVPGLIVDRYGATLVLQIGTQAAERMRDFFVEVLLEALPFEAAAVLERSDLSVRRLEGLEPRVELLSGAIDGPIQVQESGGLIYQVDVREGHKTGAYLDMSENRVRAAALRPTGRVLDTFAYDGLFGIRAALAGAEEVLCLEQNAAACERIRVNSELSGVAERVKVERVDCMKDLRSRAEAKQVWDTIIVDPPAFARNKREKRGAERGYVELNRRAMLLAAKGGHLVTASCSHAIYASEFLGHLASAARVSGRDTMLEAFTGASPDHPVRLGLPESNYLKCAFLRVT
jgi:23S rRNA (cytosine1962-C5)-methyltransferase